MSYRSRGRGRRGRGRRRGKMRGKRFFKQLRPLVVGRRV